MKDTVQKFLEVKKELVSLQLKIYEKEREADDLARNIIHEMLTSEETTEAIVVGNSVVILTDSDDFGGNHPRRAFTVYRTAVAEK